MKFSIYPSQQIIHYIKREQSETYFANIGADALSFGFIWCGDGRLNQSY